MLKSRQHQKAKVKFRSNRISVILHMFCFLSLSFHFFLWAWLSEIKDMYVCMYVLTFSLGVLPFPSPPLPSRLFPPYSPFASIFSLTLPSPNPARGSRERCELPSGVRADPRPQTHFGDILRPGDVL